MIVNEFIESLKFTSIILSRKNKTNIFILYRIHIKICVLLLPLPKNIWITTVIEHKYEKKYSK